MVSLQTENTQILDFTFLPNGFLNRAPVNTYGDLWTNPIRTTFNGVIWARPAMLQ